MRSQTTTTGLSVPLVVAAVANVMLPKLYAMAALWTLNSRDGIRSAAVVNEPPTHLDLPSFRGMTGGGTSGPMPSTQLRVGQIETTGSQSTPSISGTEKV
jgi:hypothetical protein